MNYSRLANQLLVLSAVCNIATPLHAGIPLWSFSPIGNPVIAVSATEKATVNYILTNNSKKPHRLVLSSNTSSGISQLGGPCVLAAKSSIDSNPTCTLTLSINGSALPADKISGGPVMCQANSDDTPNPYQCYQPSLGDTLEITRTTAPGTTTLSTSIAPPSILALSVKNPVQNPALIGNARQIIITNTGINEASGLTITYPSWPQGTPATTSSSTCGAILAAGTTCIITITPGVNATSNCNTGIAPTPGTITVSASNVASPITSNVVILSYGCQYQGGFLYAVDDASVNTGSIGGKVSSLIDQAAPFIDSGSQPTSIIWSSNGNGTASGDADNTTILGIDETSTVSMPSPTSPAYPAGTPAYTACNGAVDGACNSNNILSYYNFNRVNGGSAPTPSNFYAAGLCTATINTYSDWYLPSFCELGADDIDVTCPIGTQSMLKGLDFLLGDPSTATPSTSCAPPSGTDCLAGIYWVSTEASNSPQNVVWVEYFASGGGSFRVDAGKNSLLGVRCSRALTL